MSWFKVSDGMAFHQKMLRAGNEAVGAWARAGAWSSAPDNGTDGYIPPEVAASIAPAKVWAKLRAAGLTEAPTDGRAGEQIHDFLDYNPSAAEAATRREARASAGRIGGVRSAQKRSKSEAPDEATAQASASGRAEAKSNPARARPVPSRPVPDPDPSGGSAAPLGPAPPAVEEPTAQAELDLGSTARDAPAAKRAVARAQATPGQAAPGKPAAKAQGQPREEPEQVAWRTWRAAYRAKYQREYPSAGPDGKSMKSAAALAQDMLRQLERPAADLEILLVHRWRRYLADPGSAKFPGAPGFLDETKHPLLHFERGLAAYGTPWDRERKPPSQPKPEGPREPTVRQVGSARYVVAPPGGWPEGAAEAAPEGEPVDVMSLFTRRA